MSQPQRKLIVTEPGQDDREIALNDGALTIGRSRSADLQIADPAVSRIHCTLEIEAEQVWLTDNQSSLGTKLNGKPVTAKLSLADGDHIEIGDVSLRCAFPVEEADEQDEMEPGGETRMVPQGFAERAAPEADEERDTGGMLFEGTRMLDVAEMRGLKAGGSPTASPRRAGLGIALILLILGALAYFFSAPEPVDGPAAMQEFLDTEFAIRVHVPDNWSRVSVPDALAAFRGSAADGSPQLVIYADRSRENSITPLRIGFTDFIPTLRGTPRQMSLTGRRRIQMNDLDVVFFGYFRDDRQGKGIYLLNGEDRFVIETESDSDAYAVWTDRFSDFLQAFTLFRDQKTFDLDPPDETIRRKALASPSDTLDEARRQYEYGADLLRRRGVQLDNTYRAVQAFQTAARLTYALSDRPELYDRSVAELLHAQSMFQDAVRDQRFLITSAFRQRDFDTVYWEALKLMQMVPEKSHPAYREAERWMSRIPASNRR